MSSLLMALLAAPIPAPRLCVDIAFEGTPMPPHVTLAAMREVKSIWAAYGVDIRWRNPPEPVRQGAVPLLVRLADHDDPELATGALGSIDFHGDLPDRVIVLYPRSTSELVSESLIGHQARWPEPVHEEVFGRVMGRALAHEIGHFLLRTRGHSAQGLMRARQSVLDLMFEERSCCRLADADVRTLDRNLGGNSVQMTESSDDLRGTR